MGTTKDKVKELLDDYYGDSRSDDLKEQIADFVRNYSSELLYILKHDNFE